MRRRETGVDGVVGEGVAPRNPYGKTGSSVASRQRSRPLRFASRTTRSGEGQTSPEARTLFLLLIQRPFGSRRDRSISCVSARTHRRCVFSAASLSLARARDFGRYRSKKLLLTTDDSRDRVNPFRCEGVDYCCFRGRLLVARTPRTGASDGRAFLRNEFHA